MVVVATDLTRGGIVAVVIIGANNTREWRGSEPPEELDKVDLLRLCCQSTVDETLNDWRGAGEEGGEGRG